MQPSLPMRFYSEFQQDGNRLGEPALRFPRVHAFERIPSRRPRGIRAVLIRH